MPQFDDQLQNSKLAELHHREEERLISTLAARRGQRYVDLTDISIDVDALTKIPEAEAQSAEIVAFKEGNHSISVAVRNADDPETEAVIDRLEQAGTTVEVYVTSLRSLTHAWERYKDAKHTKAETRGVLDVRAESIETLAQEMTSHLDVAERVREIRASNSAERTSQTIEVLFGGALALSASDIHIEPQARNVRIRYRLDGVLFDVVDVEKDMSALLLSRLKLLSGLKLNVHDEAQDGRFTFDVGKRKLEVRSSVIPGAYGETMVMRILDPSAASFQFDALGLNTALRTAIEKELARPHGCLITTGPTGSGKTTALYAFLQKKHGAEVKIITIEDPVEYKLDGIVQTQVEEDYSFASALRAILRQDPDVIMVGEIRDREVAETAMHAALTGHFVFTTLHTNSAAGAFPRLIDLGIDTRTIGSGVNMVLGQRLVRKLCESCRVERDATTEEQKLIARTMEQPVALHSVFEAPGCDACGGIGYQGRIGIFEGIIVTQAVEEVLLHDLREQTVQEAAKEQGIPTMRQDGILKVLAGITSLDELARVVDLH